MGKGRGDKVSEVPDIPSLIASGPIDPEWVP